MDSSITIKDIARMSGVSIGTVDRVIHDRGRVSPDTKERILRAIADTGYSPNVFASRLSSSKTIVLGVIMPHTTQDSGYWALCMSGVEKAAKQLTGFSVAVRPFTFDRYTRFGLERSVLSALNNECDGLLVAPIDTQQLRRGLASNAPAMVFFDSDAPGFSKAAYVGQDSFQSGLVAGRLMHLLLAASTTDGTSTDSGEPLSQIKRTHLTGEDFAAVRVEGDDFHLAERIRGYVEYLKEKRIGEPRYFVQADTDNQDRFDQLAHSMVESGHAPKGLFVPNAMIHFFAKAFWRISGRDFRPKLIGYDLIPENLAAIQAGNIDFLLSQRPEVQGYEGIMTLYRKLVLKEQVVFHTTMPIDIITKENVGSFGANT